jgi:WD40 repeat protein
MGLGRAISWIVVSLALAAIARAEEADSPLPPGAIARIGSAKLRHDLYRGDISFSKDSRTLMSVSSRGRTVRFWDVKTGVLKEELVAAAAALSPDGKTVAVTGGIDVAIHALDDLRGRPLKTIEEKAQVSRLAFSPDGSLLAIGSRTTRTVRIVETKNWTDLKRMTTPTLFESVELSSNNKHLVVSYTTGLWLFDITSGNQLRNHALRTHRGAFMPDGKTVVATEKLLRFWDVGTGEEQPALSGTTDAKGVAFSTDGKKVVIGDMTGGVSLWDLETRKQKWAAKLLNSGPTPLYAQIQAVAISPDGQYVAAGSAQAVCLWNAETGEELPHSKRDPSHLGPLAISPSGKQLAVSLPVDNMGTQSTVLVFYDAQTGKEQSRVELPKAVVLTQVSFSPRGDLLAALDSTGTVRVINLASKAIVAEKTMEGRTNPSIAFSSDGKRLLASSVASPRGLLYSWDVATWKDAEPTAENRIWNNLTALPESNVLLTTSNTILNVFDEAGRRRNEIQFPFNLYLTSPSPDGRMIAARTAGSVQLVLIETASWKPRAGWPLQITEMSTIDFLTPRVLVTGGVDGSLALRDLYTGDVIRQLKGHKEAIAEVWVAAGGTRIVSRGNDQVAYVWDVRDALDSLPKPEGGDNLAEAWQAIEGADAERAYDAIWQFVARPEAAVAFLTEQLKPIAVPPRDRIAVLIKQLNAESFREREEATDELLKVAEMASAELAVAAESRIPEVRYRAARILQSRALAPPPDEARAIEVLERLGTPSAHRLLDRLASGAEGARLTEEAKRALARLR